MRAAIIAALDQLADIARPYRATAAVHVAGIEGPGASLGPGIVAGLEGLLAQCRQPDFVEAALAKRTGRAVGDLTRLVPAAPSTPLTPASRIRHAPLSTAHLRDAGPVVDLALPGGHIPIHIGAAPALAFIASTSAFAIRDLPDLASEVGVALVERLIAAGWLEPEPVS